MNSEGDLCIVDTHVWLGPEKKPWVFIMSTLTFHGATFRVAQLLEDP